MENGGAEGFAGFIPLIIMMIPIIFICRQLAKDKGKNTTKYTILGCIPLVNYYALFYLVGTTNRRIEKKMDQVLAILERDNSSVTK